MTISAQEIFDKVLFGMRKQGKKSTNKIDGLCLYRSDDGCQCGIGMLMDEDYRPEFEATALDYHSSCKENQPVIVWFVSKYGFGNLYLGSKLQWAHDNTSKDKFMDEFETNMMSVAEKFELNFTEA